jgi:ankyrin repeat protein
MNIITNERIFAAVELGDTNSVKEALKEEKINAASYYGAKSIVHASKQGNFEILKILLESGEKINRESFWRLSAQIALVSATCSENVKIVKLLLEHGAGTDKKNLHKALAEALLSGNQELINILSAAGAKVDKQLSETLKDSRLKEMHNAIIAADLSKVKSILDIVGLPEMVNILDILRKYSSRFSVIFGNPEMLKLFQDKRFFMIREEYSKKGYSNDDLLIKNAKKGNNKAITKLLEAGVSEKAFLSAVDAALENNHWETAKILSECKDFSEEIDIQTEYLKKMSLKASYTGDIEKVKFFLEKLIENAVGSFSDETGKSTLEIALENNPSDIIKILSNYGFHENALRHAYKCLLRDKK